MLPENVLRLVALIFSLFYGFTVSDAGKIEQTSVASASPEEMSASGPHQLNKRLLPFMLGAGGGILAYKGIKGIKRWSRCGPNGAFCTGYGGQGYGSGGYGTPIGGMYGSGYGGGYGSGGYGTPYGGMYGGGYSSGYGSGGFGTPYGGMYGMG